MLGAHGGDGDGNDPNQPGWNPPSGCRGRGSKNNPPRGSAKAKNLEAAFNKNGGPLPIYFDYKTKTWQSIGEFAPMYKSKLGSLIGSVPKYYNSWEDVPSSTKNNIFEAIQHWFDFSQYLNLPEDDPTRQSTLNTFHADAAAIYRNRKARFKKESFTDRGGIEAVDTLRADPPGDMDPVEWGKLLGFYTREDRVKKSSTNSSNRSKQSAGTQGRRSISLTHDRALAHHHNQPNAGPAPTWWDTWELTHRQHPNENKSQLEEARVRHSQDPEPTPPTQLFPEAFGQRSGHQRGLGRMLRGYSDRDFPDQLPQPVYGHPADPPASQSGPSPDQSGFSPDQSGFSPYASGSSSAHYGDLSFDPGQYGLSPGGWSDPWNVGGGGRGDDDDDNGSED